jgi:pimeloyl-ACP methyl ester carboxylesterase
VGVAAGIGPWRLIDAPEDQDPADLELLALAQAGDVSGALEGFRAQGRNAFDRALELGDDAVVEKLFHLVPGADMDWLDAEAKVRCAADLRDALRSYDGFARDNVVFGTDWDIDPTSLKVALWIWHGDRDDMVPLSHGRWLAAKVPHSTLVIRPGAGHNGSIFDYWDDMLATLRDETAPVPDNR